MKKHNASKVVLVTILVFLVLTWILPAAYYSGEYVDQGRNQMGLFDLFNYPITSLSYFGYIALFLILVGGFYGVLYKIPAYRSFLDKIVEKARGKEKIVLAVMVILTAALVSICGVHIGIALFIPFIVSIILLMGYDKIVAALVTAGSISAGLIGTTYADSNLSVLLGTLGLTNNYQIWVRFVILLVGIVLVIFNILMYIKRNMSEVKIEKKTVKEIEVEDIVVAKKVEVERPEHKKTNSKSTKKSTKKTSSRSHRSDNKAALKEEEVIVVKETMLKEDTLVPTKASERHSVWPFAVTFSLLFILFVLAFLPWEKAFGVTAFNEVTSSMQDFELFGFPIFAKVLGSINAFGTWTITDMFLPMALVLLLLVLIYNVSFKDAWNGFVEGAKEALAPAVIVVLLYTVLVLVTYHPFQLPIYKLLLGKKFNIAVTALLGLLSGFFNSDIAYSFQSVLPYYASVITNTKHYELVGIIFQSMYGFGMLFVPTSLTLMGTLSYLGVSYKDWLKNAWKLLLELFVILLIIFIILAVK